MIKSSISKVIKLNISRNFFEMHKLYRIWRYDLHFLFMQNCVFFGATFAASNWQFISIYKCVFGG